jgi:hypothetical protein
MRFIESVVVVRVAILVQRRPGPRVRASLRAAGRTAKHRPPTTTATATATATALARTPVAHLPRVVKVPARHGENDQQCMVETTNDQRKKNQRRASGAK